MKVCARGIVAIFDCVVSLSLRSSLCLTSTKRQQNALRLTTNARSASVAFLALLQNFRVSSPSPST